MKNVVEACDGEFKMNDPETEEGFMETAHSLVCKSEKIIDDLSDFRKSLDPHCVSNEHKDTISAIRVDFENNSRETSAPEGPAQCYLDVYLKDLNNNLDKLSRKIHNLSNDFQG